MHTASLISWLKLIRANVTHRQLQLILAEHEDVSELETFNNAQLLKLGLREKHIAAFQGVSAKTLDTDLEWLAKDNHHLLTITDPDYPPQLKQISSPPIALFVKGNKKLLTEPQLAMVGSRTPSTGGKEIAVDFAQHLAKLGLTITSGLALGIDAASHEGALKAMGNTIAVCGTGLDRVYPASHQMLARKIAEHGALISEFTLGAKPEAFHFPQRNRIIAGLSLGTLVVEAAVQSGSLITAQQALEFNREVFAIPGSIHNPLVRGCHQLIREGATLVECVDDILFALKGALENSTFSTQSRALPEKNSDAPPLTPEYERLLAALTETPIPIDQLVECTGFAANELGSMLLLLELQSLVISEPGGYTKANLKRHY